MIPQPARRLYSGKEAPRKRQLKVLFGDEVQPSPTSPSPSPSDSDPGSVNVTFKRPKVSTETEVFAILNSLDISQHPNITIPYKSSLSLGRSTTKNNDILIKTNDCSSVHCQFQLGQSFNDYSIITVKDLSSNGTFINDKLIGKDNTSLLRDGDKISFASQLHYIVRYQPKFKPERPSFFNKYILREKVLGTGHYAQVKEAKNRETGQICAVKIFNPTTNNDQATQLKRELDILVNLNHPNIVGFYDNFVEPISMTTVTSFLVLEKVNGGELFNRIVKKGKLNQPETKDIASQLLQGLHYLHSLDIVHRDLKPENILLSIIPTKPGQPHTDPWDEGEYSVQVKIADFGLAKFIGKFQFTTTLCGTPAYVAPEVLVNSQHRKYNKSVDMWSVGVLLYVCLCGFPPFSEELGPPSMRQQILEAKFAFYSPYWDAIDDLALDLISRLLVANADDRITVGDVLNHAWLKTSSSISNSTGEVEIPVTEVPVSEKKTVDVPATASEDMVGLRARQLSIRIPKNGGYPCEPITIQERANTGLTDEIISQRYCNFKKENSKPNEEYKHGKQDTDGDIIM